MKKLILKIVIGIVLLLIVAVGVLWMLINPIARKGVEKGATYALGVDTTVKDLNLSLIHGTLMMDTLTVANPKGYSTPHLVQTGVFDVAVKTGSVFTDTINVTKFELKGLDLNLEQDGNKNNVREILDNLKKFESAEPSQPEKKKAEGGKKLKIDKITITDIKAHITLKGLVNSTSTVVIPKLEVTNLTDENAQGLVISEVVARVLPAIVAAVVKEAGNKLGPAADVLKGGLGDLTKVMDPKAAEGILKQGGDTLKNLFEKPAGSGDGSGTELPKVPDVGGTLDKLLNKPKDNP
ncbi:MAG: hypothetical protein BIFFINMI_03894 [Phycisphaerae bacterium]|nr:hypothetical protein [Phycisphaerae bacterium]